MEKKNHKMKNGEGTVSLQTDNCGREKQNKM